MLKIKQSDIRERLILSSKILKYTVDFFQDRGFIQLLPVMLGRSTDPLGPDPNSSILKTIEVDYLGTKVRTMNSMILHKQVAVKEIGKIFILSPNIRLEKAERKSSGRHLFEFTQADFEIPYAKQSDIFRIMEDYLAGLSSALGEGLIKLEDEGEQFRFRPPFRKYTTHELEAKYGEDWEKEASEENTQPFWVLCHKREFYDKEDLSDPGHYLNYDLIYPFGYGEALSGAEREHEFERITSKMGKDKLEMEVYAAYLEEARKGLIPSAGAGFGIERLTRFLSGSSHVGDVQLFRRVPGEMPGI